MEEEAVVVNAWYGVTRPRRSGGTRCLWGVLGSPQLRWLYQGDIAPARVNNNHRRHLRRPRRWTGRIG
jgi:hypothetical protein